MPMNVNNAQIVEQINEHLMKIGNFEEMILLVDMGSLEEIYKSKLNRLKCKYWYYE